uniref:Uncharacterized protein n=1 Tax=Meloidogyne incognita TaxID=6306 RepID=A0A914NRI2_MELIC
MSSLQNAIGGVFTYSPQTSITKIVELDPECPIAQKYIAGSSSSTGGNYLENLRLVYMGVTEHFGPVDQSYFRH